MEDFQYNDDLTVSHHCQAKKFDKETRTWTGPRCRNKIPAGHLVCFMHGGNTPVIRRKAKDRHNEAQARYKLMQQAQKRGIDRIEDAVEELELIASEAKAFKDICRDRLNAIGDEWRYSTSAGEQLRSEVAVYERAIDRCNKILTDYVRLGIADKRVKIAEAQAMILVGVIQNILGRLDLTRDQKRIAATIVPEELRAIEAPKAPKAQEA